MTAAADPVSPADAAKQRAAAAAAERVEDGMVVGIGTGSTAEHFIKALAARLGPGLSVRGVPTSERTAHLAVSQGISLTALDDVECVDLTVDGADEIGPGLTLIKGGGGALLREKIVAAASRRMIVIADESKLVERLGAFPLPVEVVRFGLEATRRLVRRALVAVGIGEVPVRVRRSADGNLFLTDGGHCILDCALGTIADPPTLSAALNAIPGVVENGLFIGLANEAIIGTGEAHRIVTATG